MAVGGIFGCGRLAHSIPAVLLHLSDRVVQMQPSQIYLLRWTIAWTLLSEVEYWYSRRFDNEQDQSAAGYPEVLLWKLFLG
jgi:hypothetical protein